MRSIHVPSWVTIVVLSLAGMSGSLQFTLPLPILPSMPAILHISANDASWIITATLLSSTIATPIVSRMADMYGKRRMLLLSIALMGIGSAIVALSADFATVIVGRSVQGASSALIPIGISLLRDKLPTERANSAVALMSATLGIGSALGLPLSGVLSDAFGWHSVFWASVIAAVLLGALMLVFVTESPLHTGGRFDLTGAVLLSIVLTAALLLLSKFADWPPVVLLALTVIALVGLAGWIPLQLRHKQPMVDLRTAMTRPVLLTNIASVFTGIAMFSNMLLTTQQLLAPVASGHKFGLTMVETGLVMLPSGIVMVALAPVSGRLLDRLGGRPVLILGNAILAAGFVLRIVFDSTVLGVIIVSAVINVGVSFAFSAMPTLIMASVPNTATSAANGVNALVRSLGTAFCSALIGFLIGVMGAPNGGSEFLSMLGLHLCFGIAAASAAIATIIGVFVPRGIRAQVSAPGADGVTQIVVRGQVTVRGGDDVEAPTIVTFMRPDGAPVDWARVDGQGQYLAMLPGPGRYVAVAAAVGWAPRTVVLDVAGGGEHAGAHGDEGARWDTELRRQFTVSGVVRGPAGPAAHATVSFHRSGNDFAGPVRCDEHGAFELPLPPAGRYVVTAIAADGSWAHSSKVTVGVGSARIDLRVGADGLEIEEGGVHEPGADDPGWGADGGVAGPEAASAARGLGGLGAGAEPAPLR